MPKLPLLYVRLVWLASICHVVAKWANYVFFLSIRTMGRAKRGRRGLLSADKVGSTEYLVVLLRTSSSTSTVPFGGNLAS
jgi:hypothetical protein